MGLALLANLAARDFGYLSVGGLIGARRTRSPRCNDSSGIAGTSTIGTKRATLRPLPPLYVSSVDSGNLAGHLLTLGSGLREVAGDKIFTHRPSPACATRWGP
jgi:cyclic beta-1,2-glucan synthetase